MTSRTSSRWPRSVVVALAVTLTVGISVGVAAWPASARPSAVPTATLAAATGHTPVPLELPAKATVKPVLKRSATTSTCPAVRAHLKQYAARHIKDVACWTIGPGPTPAPARGPARTGTRLVTPAAGPVGPLCGNVANAVWVNNRTMECEINETGGYQFFNSLNGEPDGNVFFSINQNIALGAGSNTVNEDDSITMTQATGRAAGGGTVTFLPSCGGTKCLTEQVSPQSFRQSPNGQFQTIHASYIDNPAQGGQDSFTTSYTLDFLPSQPGVGIVTVSVLAWKSPNVIRCDTGLANTGTGCTFPGYMPTLTLPVATYGAAAINVLVGEHELLGTPGLSAATPLTRGDPSLKQGNRDAICDGTFYYAPWLVPTDSCDEYPFAASQQSGGQLKLTGQDCLEIVPLNNNGTWQVAYLNKTNPPQQCLRGHVPLAQNQAVGGPLGALYTTNRMIVGDPYTVVVTA
jgi:hypothetical protein